MDSQQLQQLQQSLGQVEEERLQQWNQDDPKLVSAESRYVDSGPDSLHFGWRLAAVSLGSY